MSVILELAVGEGPGQVSLPDAERLVAAAQASGIDAIRLVDRAGGVPTLDPSVVGAYLAGEYRRISYLVDVATTHNAPYNLARRVLSIDRATGGRVGLTLRTGVGDEVSDPAAPRPDSADSDSASRWAEYAEILAALWKSFPAEALRGDQAAGIVADDALIRPIGHDGVFYRVAGPLDGPSSPQGRPVLLADNADAVGWDRIAGVADAVIVDHAGIGDAESALADALARAGRPRREVAILSRIGIDDPDTVRAALASSTVSGVVLAAHEGVDDTISTLEDIVRKSDRTTPQYLRETLGLPAAEEYVR
ncbi:LLM class flavin-dependent oxidoreductase [Gordonia polyisoprenivorans]|uniref:LLM class flavin-dependent oxidoreductase n=1 Tax=Gordonia TaxID=2053 RepID=UPI00209A8289|nr:MULTISPECIES: LLM class flavin-dependent oxidoreductase [unclassified Gordonia (in: high G+C Gram-positive bacteria)]MDF3281640.1 LLM class flavin-dependent oxidoreductase [Gordonia sp. N1V]UZF56558.1 LLM class flavin-dependent oxidoreductase [Gordonia polyisoprenivorans]